MTKIIYHDRNDDAPKVNTHGLDFRDGREVAVDDIRHASLIKMAKANHFFEVVEEHGPEEAETASGSGGQAADPDAPYERGQFAAAAGQDRVPPPDLKKKGDVTAWYAGFDDEVATRAQRAAGGQAAV